MPYSGKNPQPCRIEGCTNPASVPGANRDLCKMHKNRWHKAGRFHLIRRANGEGSIDGYGYHVVYFKGRRIRYHQYVLEQKLGRRLRKGEVTHHLDENKSNNAPTNLEPRSRAAHMNEHRAALVAARALKQASRIAKLR